MNPAAMPVPSAAEGIPWNLRLFFRLPPEGFVTGWNGPEEGDSGEKK